MPRARLLPLNSSIVGLDLSLTAAAACAIPLDWDKKKHRLKLVRMLRTGYDLKKDATQRDRVQRMSSIREDIFEFVREVQGHVVFIEDHAYAAQSTANASQIVELTGAVKVDLFENWGTVVMPIPSMTARKIMLQKLPSPKTTREKVKPFTLRNVRRLGGPALEWTDDEIDAFVVANAAYMKVGCTALSFPGVLSDLPSLQVVK